MQEHLLEVKDLKVNFKIGKKKKITAVDGVSFYLDKEKTLGIVGESGCGKSVTATSILKLLPEQTSEIAGGEILFEGKDISKYTEKEMMDIRGSRISMIFQEPMTALNPVYTIGDQLIEMIQAHSDISKKDAHTKAVEMLEKVGIPAPKDRMKNYPHELSGGMRQRVMIAIALSCNPEILIADEPTTALDVTIQSQILDLINDLKNKTHTSVIMITHDMGVVAEVADYVMVMYAGKVVEYDTVDNIFNHPMHPYTQGLLKSIPRLDKDTEWLHTIEGTVPPLDNMPKGCRFCERCEECMDICREEEPKMIEIGSRKVKCHKYAEEG